MTQKNLLQSAGDGTAIPAGAIGEVRSNVTITSTSASQVNGDALTLSAGIWLLSGNVQIEGTGPTKARFVLAVISGATTLGMGVVDQSYAGGDSGTIARLNGSGLVVSVPSSAQVQSITIQTVSAASTVTQRCQAIRIA